MLRRTKFNNALPFAMPDQSNQTVQVLATAGNWIKNLDAKGAERFYKALVSRCGKTDLGKKASVKKWLPDVP